MKPIGIRNSTVVNVTGREYQSQPSSQRMIAGSAIPRPPAVHVQSNARHQPGRIQTERFGPDGGPCGGRLVVHGCADSAHLVAPEMNLTRSSSCCLLSVEPKLPGITFGG